MGETPSLVSLSAWHELTDKLKQYRHFFSFYFWRFSMEAAIRKRSIVSAYEESSPGCACGIAQVWVYYALASRGVRLTVHLDQIDHSCVLFDFSCWYF